MADLLVRGTTRVLVNDGVFGNLAFRIRSPMKDVGERLSWGYGLLSFGRFCFLLLVGLALFLLACANVSSLPRLRAFDRLTDH